MSSWTFKKTVDYYEFKNDTIPLLWANFANLSLIQLILLAQAKQS